MPLSTENRESIAAEEPGACGSTATTVPLGRLLAAAVLRASGMSCEQAAREAAGLERLLCRGRLARGDDQPF
jgi:hypothetical protein